MPSSKKLAKMADKLAEAITLIQSAKTSKALTILTKLHSSATKAGSEKPKKPLTAYQTFAKEHLSKAKKDHGSGAMAVVAEMWKKAKDTYKPKKSSSAKKSASPKPAKKASAEKESKATKPTKPTKAAKKSASPKSAEKKPKAPKATKPKSFYEFF